jgi:hypothetical protein
MASLRDKWPLMNVISDLRCSSTSLEFQKSRGRIVCHPSTIGHQIRVLEQEIQTVLIIRMNRSIKLTMEGRVYDQKIAQGLRISKMRSTGYKGAVNRFQAAC